MRIALIATWGMRCGLSTYAEHLAAGLLALGHEVFVLCEKQGIERLRDGLPPVTLIPAWTRPDPSWDCVSLLREIEADVCLFSHDWEHIAPGILVNLAKGCHHAGTKFVVGWHNAVAYHNPAQYVMEIDANVVYHPRAAEWFHAGTAHYIPHGCPPVLNKKEDATRPIPEPFQVATFGLMYSSKGLDQTILAVSEARRLLGKEIEMTVYCAYNAWTKPDFDLHLADAQEVIESVGMAGKVHILPGFPSDSEMVNNLAKADAVLLLYRPVPHRLTSSAALPFAMAAGAPVLCSNIAHFEGTQDFELARLVAKDSLHAGSMLAALLSDSGIAATRNLGAAAGEYAASRPYQKVSDDYDRLFQQIAPPKEKRTRKFLPPKTAQAEAREEPVTLPASSDTTAPRRLGF